MKTSSRLYFRALTPDDTTALIEIYSDEEAMKFRANPPVLNTEDALKMVKQALYEDQQISSKRQAVVLKDNHEIIGTFVFSHNNQKTTCTIGYSIGKKYWSKGYGTELLKTMIEELSNRDCTRIDAFVPPQNLASIRILEKQQFYQRDASKDLLTYSLNVIL